MSYEVFDWENYINKYEDLRNAGINTKENAWNHWINHGINEGRTSEVFDWENYINKYEDLRNACINTEKLARQHWIKHGKNEGRTSEVFDWENYINKYEDLKNAGINTKELAIQHWIKYGKLEGRSGNLDINFNWRIYINNYNDLQNAGINTKELAIQHWIKYGKLEGRISNTIKCKKVAIVFFGLTRCLNKTINSIKTNIFNELIKNNMTYDVFIHTYKIYGKYQNIWSGESTDNYINEDVINLLNPKYFITDIQEDIIKTINFNDYYSKLGDWLSNGNFDANFTKYLIRNLILALYSKKRITTILQQNINEYDYVIIMRPELEILNKLDMTIFNKLNNNNIVIPIQDQHSGINDRMCICKPNIAFYYGYMYDYLLEYSRRKSICSEVYLKDKLAEKNINVLLANISYNTKRM